VARSGSVKGRGGALPLRTAASGRGGSKIPGPRGSVVVDAELAGEGAGGSGGGSGGGDGAGGGGGTADVGPPVSPITRSPVEPARELPCVSLPPPHPPHNSSPPAPAVLLFLSPRSHPVHCKRPGWSSMHLCVLSERVGYAFTPVCVSLCARVCACMCARVCAAVRARSPLHSGPTSARGLAVPGHYASPSSPSHAASVSGGRLSMSQSFSLDWVGVNKCVSGCTQVFLL
jgi:hypothetical protein